MNIIDWFPEFILGPGPEICTAVWFSLGLGFFLEMLEKDSLSEQNKSGFTCWFICLFLSFIYMFFLYLLWLFISESLCCSVCGRLVMLPLCHGQQKERDMVWTCASPELLTLSRVSEHVHPLHKHKQLQCL